MAKGLDALEDVVLYLNASEPKGLYLENIDVMQKELKAFEIITTKNVNTFAIKRDRKILADFSYNYYLKKWKLYHTGVGEKQILAEEEFNLLKEEI